MKLCQNKRFMYHLSVISVCIISAAAVIVGSAVVTVNCHNAMYSDKMTLFHVSAAGDTIIITVMDKDYYL
ncbi:MAG: hypothetical protein MSJ26_08960 [Oscillospiraceae bacterium]|nr:hypothetical protein [Oscillospiraceae bacterium]